MSIVRYQVGKTGVKWEEETIKEENRDAITSVAAESRVESDEREAALSSYEEALSLFRQVGSKLGEANCYLAQGRVASENGDFQAALNLHNTAYQLYQHIEAKYSQARLLFYRSLLYEMMDERQLAIQDIEEALEIARPLNLAFIDIFEQRLEQLQK